MRLPPAVRGEFRAEGAGYDVRVTPDEQSADRPTGPLDPRGPEGPDAAAPPGGPLRSDEPGTHDGGRLAGDSPAGGTPDPEQATRPEDPQPEPPDGTVHARTQTDQVNEELQEENAETALDQPSDGSGGE